MRTAALLCLSGWFLAACGDNVQWAFVSNTSSGSGQGGLIVVVRSGSSALGLESAALRVAGHDRDGALTAHLPHGGDVAVLERAGGVEVRSPALPAHAVELAGARLESAAEPACLAVALPDASRLHGLAWGPGRLHVAVAGTLLVLECATGPIVFGERPEPEALPPTYQLTTTASGDAFALLLPDGRLRLLVPGAPAPPEQRFAHDSQRNSLRLFGPWREALAELPSAMVELHPAPGLFLRASIAGGIPGVERPTTLLMARDNRFLLRVEEP
jgi:hypothetical protein